LEICKGSGCALPDFVPRKVLPYSRFFCPPEDEFELLRSGAPRLPTEMQGTTHVHPLLLSQLNFKMLAPFGVGNKDAAGKSIMRTS
jgi:hypothetical protein